MLKRVALAAAIAAAMLTAPLPLAAQSPPGQAPTGQDPAFELRFCSADLGAARETLAALERRGRLVVLRDLEGDEAQLWIAAVNAFPPLTAFHGDTVILAAVEWSPNVQIGIFEDGCETTRGELVPDLYRAIDAAVFRYRGFGA